MTRNRNVWVIVMILGITMTLSSQRALADTVDNPGPFTITALGGYLKVGSHRLDYDPANPPSFSGMVDSGGNLAIPAAGIMFPDIVVSVPGLDDVTERFVPLGDAAGLLNPITRDSNILFSGRILLIHPSLGDNCGIGPIDLMLTTGASGGLMGVPYDQTTGMAAYVENVFSVPRSDGCGFFYGPLIDSFAGLPSPSGQNEIQLMTQVDPILTGS